MITGSHFFEAIVELTIWIADAHRDERKRFVVRADEKKAFVELESAIRGFSVSRAHALLSASTQAQKRTTKVS